MLRGKDGCGSRFGGDGDGFQYPYSSLPYKVIGLVKVSMTKCSVEI